MGRCRMLKGNCQEFACFEGSQRQSRPALRLFIYNIFTGMRRQHHVLYLFSRCLSVCLQLSVNVVQLVGASHMNISWRGNINTLLPYSSSCTRVCVCACVCVDTVKKHAKKCNAKPLWIFFFSSLILFHLL